MSFLPVVARELRVASRRKSTYWTRFGAGLGGLGLAGWILMTFYYNPGEVGMVLFGTLSVAMFAFALFSGIQITSDAISEEKREGTLGLLFLTDLKGFDVVLGKMAATSLTAFYALLAVFPIVALSIMMGGVSYAEFLRAILTSLNLMLLSLTVGLFSSALCQEQRKSASLTFLFLALACGLAPFIGFIELASNDFRNSYNRAYFYFTPISSAVYSFDANYTGGSRIFWTSIAVTQVLAWAAFIGASIVTPRSWQDKSQGARVLSLKEKWRNLAHGSSEVRKSSRGVMLDANAFYWLAARDRFKPILVWLFLLAAVIIWSWAVMKENIKWSQEESLMIFTSLVLHTVIKIWIASEACRRFVDDRKSGALELILGTSITIKEIVEGQWMALRKQFAWPVLVILVVDILFLFAEAEEGSDWVMTYLCGTLVFVVDLIAITWVSMWIGLLKGKTNAAVSSSVGRIMILPWILFFMAMTALTVVAMFAFRFEFEMVLLLWTVISLVIAIFNIAWCKDRLFTQFRFLATQRVIGAGTSRAWWKFSKKEPQSDAPPVIYS